MKTKVLFSTDYYANREATKGTKNVKLNEQIAAKEASKNTVSEAGDGTTTATILAEALLKHVYSSKTKDASIREIKEGLTSGLKKINDYLKSISIDVKDDMLK